MIGYAFGWASCEKAVMVGLGRVRLGTFRFVFVYVPAVKEWSVLMGRDPLRCNPARSG